MAPLPDESAGSLIFRLAQADHMSLSDFCRLNLGLGYTQSHADIDGPLKPAVTRRLARRAHITERRIQRLFLPNRWRIPTWGSESRRHNAPVRFCPACLASAHYGRRFWLTLFAAACPQHGTFLVSTCPRCGCPLPYFGAAGGILVQFWLETWPICPRCLKAIPSSVAAPRALLSATQRWAEALHLACAGVSKPEWLLDFSARLLSYFSGLPPHRAAAALVGGGSPWGSHIATAMTLEALSAGRISSSIFHAAIGASFEPAQLVNDISV